jgi:hypothetical protein
MAEWEPTGWIRVILTKDNSIWCETRDKSDIAEAIDRAPGEVAVLLHYSKTEEKWENA